MSLNDCFAPEQQLLSTAAALAQLRQQAKRAVGDTLCPLAQANGRVLAQALVSPRQVPGFDNAAVDGYALRASDLCADASTKLQLTAAISAGHSTGAALAPGKAARILTGARLPAGADTVVMQEDVQLEGDAVVIPAGISPGINWRPAGEDMAAGAEILPIGHKLRPQDIGCAAAMGLTQVRVYQPLKVAVFSTGDELVNAGEALDEDSVVDINRPMLLAFLSALGAEVTDLGILADCRATVVEKLAAAAREQDVILTSGGASTGDKDYIATAVQELGSLHFWRMAIKPGRPLAFGSLNQGRCVFIGFPGNPVATGVCFLRFAYPLLCALGGQQWPEPQTFSVTADFSLKKKPGRREWLRAQLLRDQNGQLRVKKHPKQGSGVLTSLVQADGLVELDEDITSVSPGTKVQFLSFKQFLG